MKVVHLRVQNRAAVIGLSVLIVGLGVILITFGIALLAALAVTGALVGTGVAIYRRLRPKAHADLSSPLGANGRLDPSLEVQPVRPPTIAPPQTGDK
jgi:hypothetical protein